MKVVGLIYLLLVITTTSHGFLATPHYKNQQRTTNELQLNRRRLPKSGVLEHVKQFGARLFNQSNAKDSHPPIARNCLVGTITRERINRHDYSVDDADESRIPEAKRKMIQYYEEKADSGDVEAMLQVAFIYLCYNNDKAFRYYQMAALHGNLESKLYEWGKKGVSEDVSKALHYYEQAADRGSSNAMLQVAWFYLIGCQGVTPNFNKAQHYLEKAAERGDRTALYFLALHYQGRDGNREEIRVANVDEARAFDLFHRSAEQGYKNSMHELGGCYRDGKGTSRDPVKAKEWFVRAIAEDNEESLYELAMMIVDSALADTEKQIIADLIKSEFILTTDVYKEWSTWNSNKRVDVKGQQGNNSTLLLDGLDLADATFVLAKILSSTLVQKHVRIANDLISKVDRHDKHDLLAWLSLWVADLCEEEKELSHINLSREYTYDVQKELRPIALIGQGQFGKVYLAWFSPQMAALGPERYVAVKVVDINLAYEDRVLAKKVVREQWACRALTAKKVKNAIEYLGYTNLPKYRKRGLVFELCANMGEVEELAKEARKRIARDPPLHLDSLPNWTTKVPSNLQSCVVMSKNCKFGIAKIITMLREAAEALLEVHKIGFIHRDIAPRNILCDAEGNIQLADFGWAKFVGCSYDDVSDKSAGCSYDDVSDLAYYGKACFADNHQYALAWWAPECFGSEAGDIDALFSFKSDVYAFGITMWQCFSGKDPFSNVKNPEDIKKNIVGGEKLGLGKKPNKGGVLDGNTPDDLIPLIDSCWSHMATDRPTLADVIKELRRIETNLQNCKLPKAGKRSHKLDPHTWCDDTKSIYRHVKGNGKHDQYDVFLVHAGEHKMGPVDTMKSVFDAAGFRCFLDCNMLAGSPAAGSMRFALTTCRYAVVVLSSEFFEKQHPASELMYAFRRMQWIRQQHHLQGWDSLIVVLFNMTVQQYKDRPRVDGIELPDSLCTDLVLVEWSGRGKTSWLDQCSNLREVMIQQDKERNAWNKWVHFLGQHSSQTLPSDFPSPDALYADDSD